ncbi:hypothetical protein TRFO_42418 [Tritrichomonas foetus]|uniref:Uncharacterized protein n=1 Tax=Tritrichomonas foetus TaxID=1144522 RepID=A0A1J4KWM4_9EUKA|nr:hypothetical protein TRFO_42418 [Tritrichomonas foetus]|eukprot:OHT15651.1 hypothetical protein TRFO_42418 [Tritrichomonas foetus]
MSFEGVFRTTRKFVLSPILMYSIYLTVIYSNDFWVKMVGTTHLSISIILMISSIAAIFFAMRAYDKDKPRPNSKQIYFVFALISFIDSLCLIYLTRDIKKMECIYWISYFISANQNTFFVTCFNELYYSSSSINYFVHQRIISVHDASICLVVITFILFILFTFLFKKILKLRIVKKKLPKLNLSQINKPEDMQPLNSNNDNFDKHSDNENTNIIDPNLMSSSRRFPGEADDISDENSQNYHDADKIKQSSNVNSTATTTTAQQSSQEKMDVSPSLHGNETLNRANSQNNQSDPNQNEEGGGYEYSYEYSYDE